MDPLTLSLIGTLIGYAPELVKYFTGSDKAEKVTEKVVDIATKVAGVPNLNDAVVTIGMDPKAQAEFRAEIMRSEKEFEAAVFADRDSARKMQIAALQQDDVFSKRFIYYFAMGWSAFSMIFFMWASFGQVANQRIADTVLGFLLGTAIAGIFQFFYGSTSRSHKKDDTILQLSGK